MTYSIEEIRKLLEATTQGEWEADWGHDEGLYIHCKGHMMLADQEFFVAAPAIVKQLLEENEKLYADNNKLAAEVRALKEQLFAYGDEYQRWIDTHD